MSFIMMAPEDIGLTLAARLKGRRLGQNLTQEGLSRRSGVALGTLKKFERTGSIALVSFIRLIAALKDEKALEKLLLEKQFETLDQILDSQKKPQRGRIN